MLYANYTLEVQTQTVTVGHEVSSARTGDLNKYKCSKILSRIVLFAQRACAVVPRLSKQDMPLALHPRKVEDQDD
jgi:hypothetical protein